MWGYGYGYPMMGGYGVVGSLLSLFWIIVAIVAVVFIIRALRGGKHSMRHWCHEDQALNLLKERYVKGEISTAEFEEKKKAIGQ